MDKAETLFFSYQDSAVIDWFVNEIKAISLVE